MQYEVWNNNEGGRNQTNRSALEKHSWCERTVTALAELAILHGYPSNSNLPGLPGDCKCLRLGCIARDASAILCNISRMQCRSIGQAVSFCTGVAAVLGKVLLQIKQYRRHFLFFFDIPPTSTSRFASGLPSPSEKRPEQSPQRPVVVRMHSTTVIATAEEHHGRSREARFTV